MISFDDFHPAGSMPIYQQILYYIKRGAVAGSIKGGDELPSRRVLSALLGINPNTVQKAFKMLEDEGLIQSRSGAKSFMTLDENKLAELKDELIKEDIRSITNALKQMAIPRDEALKLIEKFWDEE